MYYYNLTPVWSNGPELDRTRGTDLLLKRSHRKRILLLRSARVARHLQIVRERSRMTSAAEGDGFFKILTVADRGGGV